MKNHRTFWEQMKYHGKQFKKLSKRIVTTSLLTGALLALSNAVHAHEVYADFNSDEHMVLAMGSPYGNEHGLNRSTYRSTATEAGVVQIIRDMSRYGLQTNAYASTLLHQRTPDSINEYGSGGAVGHHGFLVVFSW